MESTQLAWNDAVCMVILPPLSYVEAAASASAARGAYDHDDIRLELDLAERAHQSGFQATWL